MSEPKQINKTFNCRKCKSETVLTIIKHQKKLQIPTKVQCLSCGTMFNVFTDIDSESDQIELIISPIGKGGDFPI